MNKLIKIHNITVKFFFFIYTCDTLTYIEKILEYWFFKSIYIYLILDVYKEAKKINKK